MQLLAVLAPPPEVVAEALDLAHAACEPPPAPAAEPVRVLRQWVRRPAPAEPVPVAAFTPLDAGAVCVRVARFGNVGGEQLADVAAVVGPVAARWPDPVVHVAALGLDDAEPTRVVGVLDGDVGELTGMFRALEAAVRPHGFFLDRRAFRSQLELGSLSVPERAALPDALVAGTSVRGTDWRPGCLELARRVLRGGTETLETVERFELGTG